MPLVSGTKNSVKKKAMTQNTAKIQKPTNIPSDADIVGKYLVKGIFLIKKIILEKVSHAVKGILL